MYYRRESKRSIRNEPATVGLKTTYSTSGRCSTWGGSGWVGGWTSSMLSEGCSHSLITNKREEVCEDWGAVSQHSLLSVSKDKETKLIKK